MASGASVVNSCSTARYKGIQLPHMGLVIVVFWPGILSDGQAAHEGTCHHDEVCSSFVDSSLGALSYSDD